MRDKYALPAGIVLTGGKNNYRIEEVLGQGGYGITYRVSASLMHGNIPVTVHFALKEFFAKGICERSADNVTLAYSKASEVDVRESLQDFIAEGKRLADICRGCKNIVNVNEVFEANNTAYYVMEYIRGGSLRQLVKRQGALSEDAALSYMIPIIRAVGYIHKERLLHLDIKPENIMIRTGEYDSPDEPVLIDFGVTLHFTTDGRLTSKHGTYASPGYSPMEQYEGITRFSPETDVYALAATLYYLLVGHDPASAFDIRPGFIENSLPEKVGVQVRHAIAEAMAPFAYERTQSARQFEKLLLDKTATEKEDNNKTKKFKTASNNTKKKQEKRTLAPPYSNGRIVIKVHYPTDDKVSYEFYLGSGVCDTFMVVDKQGRRIFDVDFKMGKVAAFEEKLSELGFLDENHWEIESFTLVNGGISLSCEFYYKNGKCYKRELGNADPNSILMKRIERLISETRLSEWLKEFDKYKLRTLCAPNSTDLDKTYHSHAYVEGIAAFFRYYDEIFRKEMLLVYDHKMSYCLDWYDIRDYVLEHDPDIIGNSPVDISRTIPNFTQVHTSFVHKSLDDFIEIYHNEIIGANNCLATYHSFEDYVKVAKTIEKNKLKAVRICREHDLMAFHTGIYDNTIFRIKYRMEFCDFCTEKGCYEILHSGKVEEEPSFEYSDDWHREMRKSIKEIDYGNVTPLLIYGAVKWLLTSTRSGNFKDIVLLNAWPFGVHLYQTEHGRVRDDLGVVIKAFESIPQKRTLELPPYCEELMFEIEGEQYHLDIQKDVFSYQPQHVQLFIDVDNNTKIAILLKDVDSGNEKSISFVELIK